MLPPKNYRAVIPRCCGTCRYLVEKSGHYEGSLGIEGDWVSRHCKRDADIAVDEAEDFYYSICDYYKVAHRGGA